MTDGDHPYLSAIRFRDVAEFFLLRGFEFTHETVRDWETRFAPLFVEQLRAKRKGKGEHVTFADRSDSQIPIKIGTTVSQHLRDILLFPLST